MEKIPFTSKFYFGLVLIILSFVIGKVSNLLFIFYFKDEWLRNISLAVYILSWPLLFIGAWVVGKEYAQKIKRYLTYQFYHESLKKGTKEAYGLTKAETRKLAETAKRKTALIKEKVKRQLR